MAQYLLIENARIYTKLKSYNFWVCYLEVFEEWVRDKELIKYFINEAFDECYPNVLHPKVTKKV